MATAVAAGVLAPDYKVRLILIGPVSIKYIVIVMLIMDMIGTTGNINTGGHFAHLGGALFGWFFVSNLRRGNDLSIGFNNFIDKIGSFLSGKSKNKRTKLKVSHRKEGSVNIPAKKVDATFQKRLDEILDKINVKGYDQLSDEEKDFLFLASKKQK